MREVKVSEEKSLGKMQHEFPRKRQVYITTDLKDWMVSVRTRLNNLEYVSIWVFFYQRLYPTKAVCYVLFFILEIFGYFDLQSFGIILAQSLSFAIEHKMQSSIFAFSAFFLYTFQFSYT
jgi:hypothetical protein